MKVQKVVCWRHSCHCSNKTLCF